MAFVILVSLFFLVLHLRLDPWKEEFCSNLQTTVQTQFLVVLILGVSFYNGPTEENGPTIALEVLLIIIVLSTVLLLCTLVLRVYLTKLEAQWGLQRLANQLGHDHKAQVKVLISKLQRGD